MERQAFNSLNEAALQVQSGITPEPEVNESVLEYFNNYFGDNLTEDTSDEDIMQAIYDLVDLTEAVCEAIGLDEMKFGKARRVANVEAGKANRLIDYHGMHSDKAAQALQTSGVQQRARATLDKITGGRLGKKHTARRAKYIETQRASGKPGSKKNIERAQMHNRRENEVLRSLAITGREQGGVRPHRTSSQGQTRIYDIDKKQFKKP